MTSCIGAKWRILGLIVGWLALLVSVAVIVVSIILSLPAILAGQPIFAIYGVLLLNLILNISCLYGTTFYKPRFMVLPLIWWAIPTVLCICFIAIGILRGIQYLNVENLGDDQFPLLPFIWASLSFVGFYIIAILSYKSVKNATESNLSNDPRPNIAYNIPEGNIEKNERLRIYPTLVMEV